MKGMNQVQAAWIRACEKKLGTEVDVNNENDIRLLARLATGTNGRETLVKDKEG